MKIQLWPDRDIRARKMKNGTVRVLILQPRDRPGDASVGVLWIHGGGYITGLKEMVYMSRAVNLVRKFDVDVVSPAYHLGWQKPYPAALEDCYRVLEMMNGQYRTLVVGGESAGGGLAVALCMMARDRGIRVACQFPLYPMISNMDTDSSRDNHGKVWNTRRNHLGWRMYLRGDAKKRVSPYAAPAGATDYHGLPPCYTFVGDGEPFYRETLDYVEHLREAGVPAMADVYHTNVHAFDMLWPERDPAPAAIERFEQRVGEALRQIRSEGIPAGNG